MRVRSSGSVPRFATSTLVDLARAALHEWSSLEFAADGLVRNPVLGATQSDLRLVDGVHRRVGAVYELTPQDPEAAAKSSVVLTRDGGRMPQELHPVSRAPSRFTLTRDDGRTVAVTFSGPAWEADVTTSVGVLPRVEGTLRAEPRSALLAAKAPRLIANRFGATGEATGTFDASVVEARGGRLVEATGSAKPFSGGLEVELHRHPSTWDVDVEVRLAGRGLARLGLFLGRRRLRQALTEQLDGLWADGGRLAASVDRLEREVAAEGAEAWLHRTLWDPGREHEPGPQPQG